MKLKSKKIIQIKEPVYDITVPETHNFLTESGVFVHNCDHPQEVIGGWCDANRDATCEGSKDCSDAVAACIYKIFSNPIQTSITDLANAMQKTVPNMTQGTLTTQARPVSYTSPRRMMSDREAMQKAMQLFSNRK